VAEEILTLVFELSKDLLAQDQIVRSGRWRGAMRRLGTTVEGKVLGSVGCGNIARELFRLARPLGFSRLIACDPYVDGQAARDLGVELVSLEDVFRLSDYVTVNTFLNASTRGLVGDAQLRLMKPTAFLINTARGPIVDQKALTAALEERRIAGAGLDVFEQEPIAADDPLLGLDNVILAPHGLAWTEELARDNGLEACDHILALASGKVPQGLVNREVLDSQSFQKKLARFQQFPVRRNS
jgi:phosphoglycerate dehydrogenase-like enzyme